MLDKIVDKSYCVSYKRYVNLTDEDILTFKAFDKESQQLLYKLIKPSEDIILLEDAFRTGQPIIIKPERIKIDHKKVAVLFYTKAAIFDLPLEDEVLETLKKLEQQKFYIRGRIESKYLISKTEAIYSLDIEDISFYTADYDLDLAKELLNEYEPLTLILQALGYYPTKEAAALTIPKLIPLFQPFDRAVHSVQLTTPRTGKTESAKLLAVISNAHYCSALPTPAKLVYNAATGQYGLTYFYDTLYIDEFDKIGGRRKQSFQDTYEIILSGMDNAVWFREASSKAADFQKWVGFCFLGNLIQHELPEYSVIAHTRTARDKLHELLELYDISYPKPFVERIAYCEFNINEYHIYKDIRYDDKNQVMYLHPKIARGVIKILQEKCKEYKGKRKPQSQFDIHFNNLTAILKTLHVEIDDNTLEKLIRGETNFFDVMVNREQKQTTTTDIEYNEWDLSNVM